VLRPGSSEFSVWLLVIMSVSFLMSVTRLIAKVVMRSDTPLSIVLWLGVWSTLLTLPFAWAHWQNPTFSQYIWLFVMGLIGTVQQILSMWSIKVADFGVLEPANFMKLVWAAILGFIIFTDIPSVSTMIGGTIIVASVIYVARREQLEARERKMVESEGGEL
jgi:drug/metabolite transporter (DMT)-like permease